MNIPEFMDGLSVLETQLGQLPCSEEMFDRWVSLKLKPVAHLSHERWIAIAEAGAQELSFWNQFTTFWILEKAKELNRPEQVQRLAAAQESIPVIGCPLYVKIWMAEERERLNSVPESEMAAYQASRGAMEVGMRISDEIRAEMRFLRDRIEREGPTQADLALIKGTGLDHLGDILPQMPSEAISSPVEVWS